ncbi:DAK2 domain-containing protein [Terrabacter sp. NPDC080008]|uniref:DAK2 domain-containing protein n=1 Tax=Terrabacter sp. NPDC080008 TaxID=3155176 RepID=UPI00344E8711
MPGAEPSSDGPLAVLDLGAVRRWAALTRSSLAARRTEIDALNVFPVPDGDTGTNLYLTFDGAVERTLDATDVGTADRLLTVFARHLLWTARGNSGVILSQLARGLAEGCAGSGEIDARALAEGLRRAEQRARQAVADPQEGTILTVATAMAEAAAAAVDDAATGVHAVARAAYEASRTALEHTPEQLEVLARAGVVDAGGAGLVALLECLEQVCAGHGSPSRAGASARGMRRRPDPGRPGPDRSSPAHDPRSRAVPHYEVMYLLRDSDDAAVDGLRARLVELGDSVLVVGGDGDGEWNIHAHVDDAGAAVEAGIEAGRPHRVRITALTYAAPPPDQQGGAGSEGFEPVERHPAGIVACSAGDGLRALFEEAGAVVVASGPGQRASTGAMIDAVREQHARGAQGVIVLPNDGDTLLAAAAAVRAASDEGIDAHLVHVRTAVQGLAALAVFEPAATATANALAMQAAASATRHGAVTVADRGALTSAGPCQEGDVLGVVDGDVVVVGSDQLSVTREVVRRLLGSGGELVTVISGCGAPDGLARAVEEEARRAHHGVEVSLIEGGQDVYPVLLGVE